MELRPTEKEKVFLLQAFNAFYDRYEEISKDDFWLTDSYHRFNKIKDCFMIYSEILEYDAFNDVFEALKNLRPPLESEIANHFFSFLRNLLIHFPLFNSWNEIKFNKSLINWSKPGKTIDKFLEKYKGHDSIKYRLWNSITKQMTYVSINFPALYDEYNFITLNEMLSEKEGILFSVTLMKKILDTQVEN